jgi:hypothetical protein
MAAGDTTRSRRPPDHLEHAVQAPEDDANREGLIEQVSRPEPGMLGLLDRRAANVGVGPTVDPVIVAAYPAGVY